VNGPLSGIRVLEFGSAVAAPLCGAILAEMGADVIKVEGVDKPDDARNWGKMVKGESLYFLHYNRNKRSLAVNLKDVRGREIVLKLVERSDCVVENFRPGVMERLGLSYSFLRGLNERLVYCSISGFGQTGPYSQLPGYDVIVQGMSGLMSVTGEAEGPPLRVGVPIIDILTALNAAMAVCAALFVREKTGRGQFIDVSLLETGVMAMGQWLSGYLGAGEVPHRFGNRYPPLAPYEPFNVKDGWIIVAVGNEEHWRKLCTLIGRDDLLRDERFKTNQSRIRPENRAALAAELEKTLTGRTVGEWLKVFWEEGVPAGPINTIREIASDPHLSVRKAFTELTHPVLGNVKFIRCTPVFNDTPTSVKTPAPTHGQHTDAILRDLGYTEDQIKLLEGQGVIKRGLGAV